MPRRTTDVLEHYSFGVSLEGSVNGDENAPAATIVFVDDPSDPQHTVHIVLTVAGKKRLISQLTGGIEIASQASPPG